MKAKPKFFDIGIKRPKILLLGNGLNYFSSSAISWNDLIGFDISEAEKDNDKLIPNVVKAFAACPTNDSERYNCYRNSFKRYLYGHNDYLERLKNTPFDAVLTTNYTYEFENAFCHGFDSFTDEKKAKYRFTTAERCETKYYLQTFYKFKNSDDFDVDLWHIHGEIRSPQSMILTHDEYARLIHKILEYNACRGNYYEKYSDSLRCNSWVDYFIIADIYILGFGFDFSEFDLWWLLNRRTREKTGQGKIIYFNPKAADGKPTPVESVMRKLGIECESCGVRLTDDKEANAPLYALHYERAIDYIAKEIGGNEK